MITLIFVLLMLGVFGKMIWFAIRAAWGITKVTFGIVFLPVILIVLAISGLIYIAIPVLIILGIVMIVKSAVS